MGNRRCRWPFARLLPSSRGASGKDVVFVLCLTLGALVLTSCGTTATAHTSPRASTPTLAPSPTATQTAPATATPTLLPTATPQPTAPPAAPIILDLRPSSMSFVGHLDCQHPGAYVCVAEVIAPSSNQSNLPWKAYTNVPGQITFSPASGDLAPGQNVFVSITIPLNACTHGLFFFQGPNNTHTITWAC